MADTYEKDLAQKSSLTTSDYIRVVGSDNVSYKQGVQNTLTSLGLAQTNVANNADFNDLTYSAVSGIGCYRGNSISTMANKPSGETNAYPFVLVSYNMDSYNQQVLYVYASSNGTVTYERSQYWADSGNTWTAWVKQPTRAEVDALTNKINRSVYTTTFNSTNPISVQLGSQYDGNAILYGFIQGVATGGFILFNVINSSVSSITNIVNGTSVTSVLSATFDSSTGTLTVSTTSTSNSRVTLTSL